MQIHQAEKFCSGLQMTASLQELKQIMFSSREYRITLNKLNRISKYRFPCSITLLLLTYLKAKTNPMAVQKGFSTNRTKQSKANEK